MREERLFPVSSTFVLSAALSRRGVPSLGHNPIVVPRQEMGWEATQWPAEPRSGGSYERQCELALAWSRSSIGPRFGTKGELLIKTLAEPMACG